MRPLRIYLDTSVFGGMFDAEFKADTERFFNIAFSGRFVFVVSEQTEIEIRPAPQAVRRFFDRILSQAEFCRFSADAHTLTDLYVQAGVVGKKSVVDATHVALATTSRCDGLASWNFKHIVSPDKSARFNLINAEAGYPQLFILSPRELADYEKHEKEEPSFFKWIRAARAEISRDTEGMTAEEHAAYIHAKAEESRLERAAKSRSKMAANV